MADRKLFFTAAVIAALASFAYTQTEEAAVPAENYYIKDTKEGAQFIQRFSWQAENGALRYEFFIDKIDEKTQAWVNIAVVKTDTNSAEASLTAGSYRYKVVVYNMLDIAETESAWQAVEIIKAYQPELKDVYPRALYLEEENDGVFSVTGEELRPETKFYLATGTGEKGRRIPGTVLENDRRNKRVKVQFDMNKIDTAVYRFIAVNPGGLNSEIPKIIVKFKKAVDFDVSAGYSLPVILYDTTINDYFGSNIWPLSAHGKMELMPFKHKWGYLGFSLDASYFFMYKDYDTYSLYSHVLTGNFNLVYQKFLYKRVIMADIHAGSGVTSFTGTKFIFRHVESEPFTSININANCGAALQLYVQKRLYIETGADYIHAFTSDMTFGMIQPEIAIGWQF